MSSILDALRKLENAETPRARGGVPVERPRRGVALGLAGLAVAFAAGVGAAFWLRGGGAPTAVRPVETAAIHPAAKAPEPTQQARAALPEPARAVPAVAPVPTPAPPAAPPEPAPAVLAAARVPPAPAAATEPTPAARAAVPESPPAAAPPAPPVPDALPPAAPAVPPSALLDAEPPRVRLMDAPPAPMRRAEPPSPPHEARPATPPPAPPPPIAARARPSEESPPSAPHDLEVLQRPPAGAPAIQVNFLVYSRLPERRTVALTIDGGSMVTMREGEASGEVEVVRILPDRVHVRHAGQLFAVRAIQ